MNSNFRLKALALFLSLNGSISLATTETDKVQKQGKITDLAALSIQDKSIRKLKSLVHQYQGTSREPELLSRLGDLYLERSGISFRISEGTSIKNKSPLYHTSLKEGVAVLNELIRKYPYHITSANSHFKRGKAYKELAQVSLAKLDFLYIQQHHSDFDFLDSVLIDLADFAQDANEHKEALSYLSQIEKMNESEYLPMALHKSAWSYFNLGAHESSIAYLEKEINFYYSKIDAKTGEAGVVTAESAFLDSAFSDLALFYFEAINKKSEFASIDHALKTFTRLDKHQHYFGTLVLKFAKLLKAYTLTDSLDQLRGRLVKDYQTLPESGEVALLLFQYHFDRRDFNHISPLISDLKALRNVKTEVRIEQTLATALSDLHKLVLKNKLATERATLVRPLVSLTESVGDLLGKENPTALLANYALAETLFELKDFPQATQYYHDLLKPEYSAALASKKLTHSALTLRLLSSRYQELKNQDLIPQKLKIKSIASGLDLVSKEQTTSMKEWVSWLDASSVEIKAPEEKPSYDAFSLEANKILYLYVDRELSISRLVSFGITNADADEGITSLTIALDTLSESGLFERVYELSGKISKIKDVKNKEFFAKNETMRAESHLKVTLQSKDNSVTLTRTENCLKEFKNPKILNECRNIHAKTAALLGQYEVADKELSLLLKENQDSTHTQSLLLLRADARNKLGRVSDAIQDLDHYQHLTHYQDAEITEQILEYSWFRDDSSALDALLKNTEACQGKNQNHCDQYRVARMVDHESKTPYLTAFRNSVKSHKEVQSLWAMIALQEPKKIAFQDRLILLQRLGNSWEHLNPLLQIRLFPKMLTIASATLESIRVAAPGIAPLTADTARIERRMNLMQDIDLTFSKVMKLNWIDLKRKGAQELVIIYSQLISDLKKINTPPELLTPFNKKLLEIQTAVQNLDAMAFEFRPIQRAPASDLDTPESLLLSSAVKEKVPSHLWNEWKKGVQGKKRDYLFHLVSLFETQSSPIKEISPALKGLVLLLSGAPTEAYALIETSSESPWKAQILAQFGRRKP